MSKYFTGIKPSILLFFSLAASYLLLISERHSNHEVCNITFEKEKSYGDSERVIIGRISSTVVDDDGRVFIADSQRKKVHIFKDNGSYLKSIGREGRGPGEFQFLGEIAILSDKLIVVDTMLSRISAFSLSTLEHLYTSNLTPTNQRNFEELNGFQLNQIFVVSDSTFLLRFIPFRHPDNLMDDRFMRYYLANREGRLNTEMLLEQPDSQFLQANIDGHTVPARFNFLGRALLDISPDGKIYSAWSDEFRINVINMEGEHIRTFEHPFENAELNLDNLIETATSDHQKRVLRNAELPDRWPALDQIMVDDESHIWVSAITDSDEIFQWFVLDSKGNEIATFEWAGNRHTYSREIQYVRNSKLYALEVEESTGLEKVVSGLTPY